MRPPAEPKPSASMQNRETVSVREAITLEATPRQVIPSDYLRMVSQYRTEPFDESQNLRRVWYVVAMVQWISRTCLEGCRKPGEPVVFEAKQIRRTGQQ